MENYSSGRTLKKYLTVHFLYFAEYKGCVSSPTSICLTEKHLPEKGSDALLVKNEEKRDCLSRIPNERRWFGAAPSEREGQKELLDQR